MMKYFSMFTGVGGFELGIQRAHDNKLQSQTTEERVQNEGWDGNTNEQGACVLSSDNTTLCNGGFELGIQRATTNIHAWNGETPKGNESSITSIESMGDCKSSVESARHNANGNNRQTPICVGVCEIDKYASELLADKFKGVKNYGNAREINTDELEDFDLLVGGFPCQAFSIAGKRRGFEDTRGTLFYEIARIVKAKQPRLLLLENVKGLLNHDGGETFTQILSTLDELGYDVEWQVLNSKHFGVPQNRERVFIKGCLRGSGGQQIFPIIGERSENIKSLVNTGHDGTNIFSPEGIGVTLKANGGGQGAKTGLYCVAMRGRNPANSSDRTVGAPTEQRLEPNSEGTSNCLSTVQKDNLMTDGKRIRRLTPTECERLQGFPDGWTEEFSATQRYKMMGNAVTVNVIEAIFNKWLEVWE